MKIFTILFFNEFIFICLRHAFATFDSNNDGTIDFDEFLLAIAATNQGNLDERLGFAFEMYDSSGDGQIDQKELASLILAMVEY
jgi:Ca2+-binding EF-hand superfamily protein